MVAENPTAVDFGRNAHNPREILAVQRVLTGPVVMGHGWKTGPDISSMTRNRILLLSGSCSRHFPEMLGRNFSGS